MTCARGDSVNYGAVLVLRRKFMKRLSGSGLLGRTFLGMTAVCVLTLLCVSPLRAQVDAGSILGTVTDASGSAVRGATVTLLNEGTAASLAVPTGPDGGYKFTPVRVGSYKITVTFQGFETIVRPHINVNVGESVVADFSLKPGNVTTTVEVTAAAPVLQSQDASVGQVVDSRSVNDLPLNGRNFTFLAQLAAGVNTPQADTRGNAASGAFSANGLRPAQNNYLLDGIDNNSDTVDFLNGTNFVVLPPVDAVQEFKVQTSDFSAQFGRSGAAVLNATIKSGTNEFHGDVWEFFRNDKLDAADFFENANGVKKGELRQNQFGFTAGGPVVIPHVFNGRNKVFIFGDYEGLRRVQGTILSGTVPTVAERNSWNAAGPTISLQDYITGQTGTTNDDLCTVVLAPGKDCAGSGGTPRTFPKGTIFDPSTTRLVTAGQVDPRTGLIAESTGFTRDPFGTCPANTLTYTMAGCNLNIIPFSRLDPNSIKLLNLFPLPTTAGTFGNFGNSPKLFEHRNSFDTRMDVNFNEKNQIFFRFSLTDDPQFIPGIFGGIADGGAFQQGPQTAIAEQTAIGYTHTFSPTLINEVRAGFNYLHTTRASPVASQDGLPAQFGVQDIPQGSGNGGLPAFGIGGLSTLGSNAFLPSNEVSSTFQLTDDVTKIYGKHTFKMGIEYQHVKFSTLQPPWSHGQFSYGGYTEPSGGNSGNVGIADFLLVPETTTVPGGIDYVGGANSVFVSNISLTDNGKNYYGGYAQDDWKISPKLTVNLGLRYDFFGLVFEHHSNQANFVPDLNGSPTYLMPGGKDSCDNTFVSVSFTTLLAQDGIKCLATNQYGAGLGHSQKTNFSPRVGFAYQFNPKLVVRGGFGLFYNGFENRGFSPNIGENYPFQFNFSFFPGLKTTSAGAFDPTGLYPYATAGPGGTPCGGIGANPMNGLATFEAGFSCTPLSPLAVNASGLALRGIQFNYLTPYTMSGNLTIQYQLTPSMSVQAGYVTTQARHLETFPSTNNVPVITDNNANQASLVPYPDFGRGNSYAATQGNSIYQGLQTKLEKQFAGGLNFLATYTYSKTISDAGDLLNGGSVQGYRAPSVPGLGIHFDYGLAGFDIRNVFHFSGGYELPFGKGKRFAANATGLQNHLIGGWTTIWSTTLQGGQPIGLSCPSGTAAGLGCGVLRVKGQALDLGFHTDANGKLNFYGNPAAFAQPCTLGPGGVPTASPTGCVPLTGAAALGGLTQLEGPGFHRLDFSIFKNFAISERFTLQFRTEIFNILNHPNFNAPNFGGNGVVAISNSGNFTSSNFGEIGSTRDAPYDPRQIQFALKLVF
jgi:Carboxypeptidase regulatory-like domain/TonB dependent receptor